MSNLRKHLDAEREKHRTAKYPGDLSIDILAAAPARIVDYADRSTTRPVSIFKILGTLGALAAAAALALVVWINHEPSPTKLVTQPQIIETIEQEQSDEIVYVVPTPVSLSESIGELSSGDLSIAPSGISPSISIVPEYQSMSFPSMPSFSDPGTTDETQTTSEEAV